MSQSALLLKRTATPGQSAGKLFVCPKIMYFDVFGIVCQDAHGGPVRAVGTRRLGSHCSAVLTF